MKFSFSLLLIKIYLFKLFKGTSENVFSVGQRMANVVVTNVPAVSLPAVPTPHPGAKYANTYLNLGVRNVQLMAVHFVSSYTF